MTALSVAGGIVRQHDPDRFFTALFAPAERREALFTLYAFNHELARAREAAREPMVALIRLQWWREVVEGKRVRHEVAWPLGEALDTGVLQASALGALVDAREAETEAMPDAAAFEQYVLGTAGGLMVAAGLALGLGAGEAEALRRPGGAFGITGVLRSAAVVARQGRGVLPAGMTDGAGGVLPEARLRLEDLAREWLGTVPRVARGALASALPAVLARRRLRTGGTVLGDRVAVLAAAVRGRV